MVPATSISRASTAVNPFSRLTAKAFDLKDFFIQTPFVMCSFSLELFRIAADDGCMRHIMCDVPSSCKKDTRQW